jgi:hypothetical protein
MKKIVFVLIILFPCLAFAQKKSIDSFMDIPFGSDSATVIAAVVAKSGIRVDSLCKKNKLVFTKLSLGQRPVSYLSVYFVNNKAYDAFFHFTDTGDTILSYYDDLATDITGIYGKAAEVANAPGYSNTEKIAKLLFGNIEVKTIWQAKNKNAILLHIVPEHNSLIIELRYESSALWDLAAAKRRSDL